MIDALCDSAAEYTLHSLVTGFLSAISGTPWYSAWSTTWYCLIYRKSESYNNGRWACEHTSIHLITGNTLCCRNFVAPLSCHACKKVVQFSHEKYELKSHTRVSITAVCLRKTKEI